MSYGRVRIQVLQAVDCQMPVAMMSKPLQLRCALVLLSLYKAGENDMQPAASQAHRWIWELLQGPVGRALTAFPTHTADECNGQQVACQALLAQYVLL